ncbi:MAG: LptF/LptG family permease [Verrucomicrobia bacterium]|nr:LptF/LptG family permease [Verrucomicrobiota bacterium]
MRLTDRYILREFLTAFGYCLLAFVLMQVVFDMFQSLREFLDCGSPTLTIVTYYLLILPSAVASTLPAAIFFGLVFALVTMSKNNELTAMRAAGQSLLRSSLGVITVALAMGVGLFVINEVLVPTSAERAAELLSQQKVLSMVGRGSVSEADAFTMTNLTYVNNREERKWLFRVFNTKTLSGENVDLHCQTRGQPEQAINAGFAYWLGDHWLFQDVKVISYPADNSQGTGIIQKFYPRWESPAINDLPEDMMLFSKKEPEFMTIRQVRRYLELHPKEELAKFRVSLQQRHAFPWSCVVACLMAIPLGAGTSRRSALAGVASAMARFVLYFILYYIGVKLGKTGRLDPVVAVWAANGVFTVVGAFMMWRIR